MPFHKNSHDHWIINYYINSSLDDEKDRFLRVKLHSVHADAASYSTGLAWCCFDSLNETSTGIYCAIYGEATCGWPTKRLRPEEVFESIEEKLCCRSTRQRVSVRWSKHTSFIFFRLFCWLRGSAKSQRSWWKIMKHIWLTLDLSGWMIKVLDGFSPVFFPRVWECFQRSSILKCFPQAAERW